jgi:hypothetical protein
MSSYGSSLSRGKVAFKSRGGSFAFSKNVGTTVEDLWQGKILTPPVPNMTYLETAEKMLIASTSADDSVAGSGTQIISITGVTAGYAEEITELVETNGIAGKLTVNEFIGINDIICIRNSVLGESNKGIITATSEDSGHVQSVVEWDALEGGKGNSHGSHYFIPMGKEGTLKRLSFTGEKNAEYRIEFVTTVGAYQGTPSQIVSIPVIFFESSVVRDFEIPPYFPEGTRVKIIAKSDQGTANQMAGSFDLEISDKGAR